MAFDAVSATASVVATGTRWDWDVFFTRFQSVGPTIAAAIVLVGVLLTLRQKNKTDDRTLWWARVQWAADKLASPTPGERDIGGAAVLALAAVKPESETDRELLAAIADARLSLVAPGVPDEIDVEYVVTDGSDGV